MENTMQTQQAQDRLKEIREDERTEEARKDEKSRQADAAKEAEEKERGEALSGPAEPLDTNDDQRARDADARKEDDHAQDARRDEDRRKEDDRKQDQRRDDDRRKEDDKEREAPRALDDRAKKPQEAAKAGSEQPKKGVGLDEQVAQAKAAEEAPKSLNTPSGNLTRPSQKSVLAPKDLANHERQQNTPRPSGERVNSAEVTPQDSQAERNHRSNAARNQQGSKTSMDAYLAAQAKESSSLAEGDDVGKTLESVEKVEQTEVKAPAKNSVSERMTARNAESSKANVEAGKLTPPAKTQAHAEKVDAALGQERAKRVEKQESLSQGSSKPKQQELSR